MVSRGVIVLNGWAYLRGRVSRIKGTTRYLEDAVVAVVDSIVDPVMILSEVEIRFLTPCC